MKLVKCLPIEELVWLARSLQPVPKQIAFAASKDEGGHGWCLSVVVKDELGHQQLSPHACYGDHDAVQKVADEVNDKGLKLTRDQAMLYVASSMVGTHDKRRT